MVVPTVAELAASLRRLSERRGSLTAAWDDVLDRVAQARGLPTSASGALDAPERALWGAAAVPDLLGAVHEATMPQRQASGSFYTPPALVGWVLDRVLEPDGTPVTALDPACGCGSFLVSVVRRLAAAGGSPREVVARVHGVDLDPVAVAICRLLLRLEAPDADPALLEQTVRVGDGLGAHPGAPYDLVVGNPPFAGRLRGRGAPGRAVPRAAGSAAYTDLSAEFLRASLDLVRPGGRVALVQPLSLLSTRDAAPVRAAVSGRGRVVAFWSSAEPVFSGTNVPTCAPVVELGAPATSRPVATWHGREPVRGPDVRLDAAGEWGALAAPMLGIPTVDLDRSHGVLGDLAACTADFRDQYYGLVPFVAEAPGPVAAARTVPLVTSGLIDPALCRWGRAPTRFAKTTYAAPVVDLDALHGHGALSAWTHERLVPKVLVATQGRVLEAVVDVEGAWLPSVPVISVVAPPERLWHVLAVLLAPPVVAHAAARYAGSALHARALKLSARQVATLPLPGDRKAWDVGAGLARAAQQGPPEQRPDRLEACAAQMCTAYGVGLEEAGEQGSVLDWWVAALAPRAGATSTSS